MRQRTSGHGEWRLPGGAVYWWSGGVVEDGLAGELHDDSSDTHTGMVKVCCQADRTRETTAIYGRVVFMDGGGAERPRPQVGRDLRCGRLS
jgi:hypothetical protein